MKKAIIFMLVILLSVCTLFAAEIQGVGYGASLDEAKLNASNKLIERIKSEIFRNDPVALEEFNPDDFTPSFSYSDLIVTGSSKPGESFRIIAYFDSSAIRDFLKRRAENALKESESIPAPPSTPDAGTRTLGIYPPQPEVGAAVITRDDTDNTANTDEESDTVPLTKIQPSNSVNAVSMPQSYTSESKRSYEDFLLSYSANEEERKRAEEERIRKEIYENERNSRMFKLTWQLGGSLIFPITKNPISTTDNDKTYITNAYGIQAGIGTIINNNILVMFSAIPTFATKRIVPNDKTAKTKTSTGYDCTFLDLALAYRFKWNTTDLYAGVSGGFAADTAKHFYIMPQLRLGLQFDAFRPVFDSADLTIGAKYTFDTKIWSIGVYISLIGIY